MDVTQIRLSGLWVALMLTYLLGDVLRIYSGDFTAGRILGMQLSQLQWLGVAILMVIPIVMVVVTLTLDQNLVRWSSIIVAALLFLFNAIGLPSYPSAYDRFLIVVGLGFNLVTIWYAWQWSQPPSA
jgi:hypothetical protein